jgi:hypothetical protein
MKTHIDEAKEELNREFTADRDYTPTPSLFNSLNWSFVLFVLLVAFAITIAIFGIVHDNKLDQNKFEVLHLPACDNPDWNMSHDDTGSWFRMLRGSHSLAVDKDGSLWFDHVKVLSANTRGEKLYTCIETTQINNFSSLK